jgi:hypothetical protein
VGLHRTTVASWLFAGRASSHSYSYKPSYSAKS